MLRVWIYWIKNVCLGGAVIFCMTAVSRVSYPGSDQRVFLSRSHAVEGVTPTLGPSVFLRLYSLSLWSCRMRSIRLWEWGNRKCSYVCALVHNNISRLVFNRVGETPSGRQAAGIWMHINFTISFRGNHSKISPVIEMRICLNINKMNFILIIKTT